MMRGFGSSVFTHNLKIDRPLEQALIAANSVQNSYYKSYALSEIARVHGTLNQPDKAAPLLEQALIAANLVQDSSYKSYALSEIAEGQAKLGNWKQSRLTATQCDTNSCRAYALSEVLTVWAEQQHPELEEEE